MTASTRETDADARLLARARTTTIALRQNDPGEWLATRRDVDAKGRGPSAAVAAAAYCRAIDATEDRSPGRPHTAHDGVTADGFPSTACVFLPSGPNVVVAPRPRSTMATTIEINDDLQERLDVAREEGESYEELIEELLTIYEEEGAFLREGYSE